MMQPRTIKHLVQQFFQSVYKTNKSHNVVIISRHHLKLGVGWEYWARRNRWGFLFECNHVNRNFSSGLRFLISFCLPSCYSQLTGWSLSWWCGTPALQLCCCCCCPSSHIQSVDMLEIPHWDNLYNPMQYKNMMKSNKCTWTKVLLAGISVCALYLSISIKSWMY